MLVQGFKNIFILDCALLFNALSYYPWSFTKKDITSASEIVLVKDFSFFFFGINLWYKADDSWVQLFKKRPKPNAKKKERKKYCLLLLADRFGTIWACKSNTNSFWRFPHENEESRKEKKNLTAFNLAFSSQVLFLSPYTAHRAMSMWETTVMLSVFKPSVSSTTRQGFVCVFRRDYSPSLGPSFYPFCRIPAAVPPHHCLSIPQWTSQ